MNPIEGILNEKNFTPNELAVITEVDVVTVRRFLNGEAKYFRGELANGLSKLGYDTEKLAEEYAAWRSEKAQGLRLKM